VKRHLLVIAIAAATGIGAQAVQTGPDVSGRWTREANGAPQGAGANAGWGPSIEIQQIGNELTVRSPDRPPTRYKADGVEVTETLEKASCYERSRVTKTVGTARSFTITTWLVTRTSCFHGEMRLPSADPEASRNAPGTPAGSTKVLESVTNVGRVDDRLTVDTTTSSPGGPRTSSSTYRR